MKINQNDLRKLVDFFLLNGQSEHDLEVGLEALLTPKEITELSTRLKIVELLKAGVLHHQIAQQLGVGVATVTRGSKELKSGKFGQVKL